MTGSDWLFDLAERAARVAAAIAILFACAVMVHQHSHQADRAPYVAVDDALANVSVSMVALGRNGFPASPIQALAGSGDDSRHQVQLNYGYAPFALGASLNWLFGTSYPVLRGIHIAGLILIIGAAWLSFRTTAPLGALIFAGVVAGTLWPTHWPMFRPDIGTALSGMIAVAFATAALSRNGLLGWLGTGFFAATAFGSHQIAWAMVPWAGIIWLISLLLTDKWHRWSDVTFGPFIVVVGGGILGLIAYAKGIGWRIGDILAMWTTSWDFLANRSEMTYLDVIIKHLQTAWLPVGSRWTITLYAMVGLCFVLPAILIWRRSPLARPVAAAALPGASATVMYLLGVGFYRNWHSGYTLLLQLSAAWTLAGGIAGLAIIAAKRFGTSFRLALAIVTVCASLIVATQAHKQARAGTVWSAEGARFVPFSDYEARVFAEIPHGASAAGSVIFGLKSGTRHHLIQLSEAMALMDRLDSANRDSLFANHLVLNSEVGELLRWLITQNFAIRAPTVASGAGLLGDQSLFSKSGFEFGETAIVYAEPYGETRVLTRQGLGRPAVSIYDQTNQTWASRFAPSNFTSTVAHDVSIGLKGGAARLKADGGLRLHVDPGTYLVEVEIDGRAGGPALVSGAPDALIEMDPSRVNPLGIASVGLAFAGNKSLHVIMRAPTGVGFIGYFGAPLARPLIVKRVEKLLVDKARSTPVALPPLTEWLVHAKGGQLSVQPDQRSVSVVGAGIPVGYQLVSPAIAVPQHSILTLKFRLSSTVGTLALGFVDKSGYWIEQPVRTGSVSINTQDHRSVHILLLSLDAKAHPEPARFELDIQELSASSIYGPHKPYVDILINCSRALAKKPPQPAADCPMPTPAGSPR